MRSRQGLVGGPSFGARHRVRDARRGALEDEPADDVRDARWRGEGRSGRRASSRRRRRARHRGRRRIAARSSAVRSTVMRLASPVARCGRGPAGPRRSPGTSARTRRHDRPTTCPRPVKPWISSSGVPVPRARTSQRRPSTSIPLMAGSPPRRPRRPRGGARHCAPDRSAARAPGRPAQPIDRSTCARRSSGPTRTCSPPSAVTIGARSIPWGVPNSSSYRSGSPTPGMAADAWGRNEKMPPPSLLTRTIVADSPWSFAATSALRSWRNDRSPTTSATGAAATAAEPSAVDTTPSIPLAPRFERTVIARSVDGSQPSMSRTGIEFPAHSVDPSGRAAGERRERRAFERLVERGQPGVHRLDGGAVGVQPIRGPGRVAGPAPEDARGEGAARSRPDRRGRRSPGSARTRASPDPPSSTISSGLVRASSSAIGLEVGMAPVRITSSGRWASIQAPCRTSWSARATTRLRSWRPVRRPDSGSARIGNPVRAASAAEGSGEGRVVVRARDDQPAVHAGETLHELVEGAVIGGFGGR